MAVLRTFALCVTGSSLTTGRLSTDWRARLRQILLDAPECKGPLVIYDEGHGGWTSADILGNAARISGLKPTHIWFEGGAINDCYDPGTGPTISRAQHNINNVATINEWKTNTPNSILTLHTMSSVSSVQTGRTQLATYYADEIATATANSVAYLDHFSNWPNPLAQNQTFIDSTTGLGDGLHPIQAAFDAYSLPAKIALARAQMAAFWP